MENPLVSIVIPVYNGEKYVREAIDSALAQTYDNFEVIVVNDGSTDGTDSICRSYGDKIRYYSKENGGVSTALNLGIRNMHGEYFSWLSHDDLYYPEKLKTQIEALYRCGDTKRIVHTNIDLLLMDEARTVTMDFVSFYSKERLERGCFAPVFLSVHFCSMLVHKSHFERVGLFDESLPATQDWVWELKAMKGQRSLFIEQPLAIIRSHPEQGQKTMECHKKEYNEQYIKLCEMLDDDEKINICDSVQNFYMHLYLFLLPRKIADECLTYLYEKLMSFRQTPDLSPIEFLHKTFAVSEIYLFGAGLRGKTILQQYRNIGICVNGFIDNAEEKQGTSYDGVPVISFNVFLEKKENALVIISVDQGEAIALQLKEAGVKNFVFPVTVTELLFSKNFTPEHLPTPPNRVCLL